MFVLIKFNIIPRSLSQFFTGTKSLYELIYKVIIKSLLFITKFAIIILRSLMQSWNNLSGRRYRRAI